MKHNFIFNLKTILILIIGIFSLNIIFSYLPIRLDTTSERRFTLSSGSKNLIDKFKDEVTVKFYFSRSNKNIPPQIKNYADYVEDFLKQYSMYSGKNIKIEFQDPKPDTEEEAWAKRYGLKGVQLSDGQELIFGAVFLSGRKESVMQYFDMRRDEFLEYDISEALYKLQEENKLKVGILSSVDVMKENMGYQSNNWAFVDQLSRTFNVSKISPDVTSIPDVKLLIVFHPKNLKNETLYAIDQFVMNGGRLIIMVDPFSRFDLDEQFKAGMVNNNQMPKVSSNLNKLFSAWDIEYDDSKVVADKKAATQINLQGMNFPYPLFISVRKDGFSTKSIATSYLNQMIFPESGNLNLKSTSTYSFDYLISTSNNSGLSSVNDILMSGPMGASQKISGEDKAKTLAGLLRGKFKSAFKDGEITSPNPHLAEAKSDGVIAIIADTDFIFDNNCVRKLNFGNQVVLQPMNDNLSFVNNLVDFMGGSEDLITIRTRNTTNRPFDKVITLQEQAQQKWKDEESSLNSRLQDLQKKLGELQNSKVEGNKLTLSQEQNNEIIKYREEEVQVRKRYREVRKNLREDIEKLGNWLTFLNMIIVPLGVAAFAIFIFSARNKLARKDYINEK